MKSVLGRVGWLLWGLSDAEAFPCCSLAAIPKKAGVSLVMGSGWDALGHSRYCSPWHTAASDHLHLLLLLRQFCSEPPTHLQLYEEETHFLMKPELEVMNLLAPKSQGAGQSHLVQLTFWQVAGSPCSLQTSRNWVIHAATCRDTTALQAGIAMQKLKLQVTPWFVELQVQVKRKS